MDLEYAAVIEWVEQQPPMTPMRDYHRLWACDNPLSRYLAAQTATPIWAMLDTTYEGSGRIYRLPRWAQIVLDLASMATPYQGLRAQDVLALLRSSRVQRANDYATD